MKSLELAQKSTASMGKFDKKVNKYEPDAPNSMKKRPKKSNESLNKLQNMHGQGSSEKERNLKILGLMQKEKEYKAGGSANAALDTDKMVKNYKKKEQKATHK